jgi:hypothetical protein
MRHFPLPRPTRAANHRHMAGRNEITPCSLLRLLSRAVRLSAPRTRHRSIRICSPPLLTQPTAPLAGQRAMTTTGRTTCRPAHRGLPLIPSRIQAINKEANARTIPASKAFRNRSRAMVTAHRRPMSLALLLRPSLAVGTRRSRPDRTRTSKASHHSRRFLSRRTLP